MTAPTHPLTRRRFLVGAGLMIGTIAVIAPLGKGCQSGDSDFYLSVFQARLSAQPTSFVEGTIETVALTATFSFDGTAVTPPEVRFTQVSGPSVSLSASGTTATANVALLDVSERTALQFRVTAEYGGLTAQADETVYVDPAPPLITAIVATPDPVLEGSVEPVTLTATFSATPRGGTSWRQLRGRRAGLHGGEGGLADVDVSAIQVATDAVLEFELAASRAPGWPQETATVEVVVRPVDAVSALGEGVQIGGQTVAAATFTDAVGRWALFNTANRLRATRVGTTQGEVYSVYLPGSIRDLDVVTPAEVGSRHALAAMGSEGIAVVDVTDPAAMRITAVARVGHLLTDVTMTDGGGSISTVSTIQSLRAEVTALETDGTTLWIADGGYGVHRTPLSNLLGPDGPALGPDGTLLLEASAPTVQYAGENPWGGPRDMRLIGGRLYAALGYLGLAVIDPEGLEVLCRYNLYTDASVSEDFYGAMNVADEVQSDAGGQFLDPVTGMPDYRQAAFEITEVWHGGATAPTPWADFERNGRYYYDARAVDVQEVGEGRLIAYVAYGLAGLVAVEVSCPESALAPPSMGFLGYLPAVPAHGPEREILRPSTSLFPTYGSHRLAEAGAVDVRAAGDLVLYTDHFGGLIVVSGAGDPASWRSGTTYDNDTVPPLGNRVPPEEFVTWYDMSPADPTDHESLPAFMTQAPVLLATGELYGHGNALALLPDGDLAAPGQVDALLCAAAGGFAFVDLSLGGPAVAESTALYTVPAYFPTTDEVGALPDGAPGQTMSIGHTDGVATSADYLYVADGPHGVSGWRITAEDGEPMAPPRVVANTVQSEGEVVVDGVTVYPTPHAHDVHLDGPAGLAYVPCRTAGLRRVGVDRVERGDGRVGTPILIGPGRADIFKHKLEETHEDGEAAPAAVAAAPGGLTKQDHAYDVALRGTLAFVADGDNGLTVYDLLRDPSDPLSGFVVGNLGGASGSQPLLGRATGLTLWTDPATQRDFAIMACGPRGVGVVDVTQPAQPVLVKVFEPIKLDVEAGEEGEEPTVHVSAADGRCADVIIAQDHAYVSYDSFGVLCYALSDLTAPLPPGVDPTALWTREGGPGSPDYRPVARAEFRLSEVPEYADLGGGALGLVAVQAGGRLTLWVAYGAAGLVGLDWSTPTAPALERLVPTVGDCTDVAVQHGWLYVADHDGGLAVFR